jgi:hypothetical protein
VTVLPPYPVLCHARGCRREAQYKIAARWSDGQTHELKTYSLCCSDCLATELSSAEARYAVCRLAPGETLTRPEVYDFVRGIRDSELVRRQTSRS